MGIIEMRRIMPKAKNVSISALLVVTITVPSGDENKNDSMTLLKRNSITNSVMADIE